MNRRIFRITARYIVAGLALLLLGCIAWFAHIWDLDASAIFPLYLVGLMVCAIGVAIASALRKSN
jgi:hypothetical protein